MRKSLIFLLILVLGLVPSALAQEATPEAILPATEDTPTTIGPLAFTLPQAWYGFPQEQGNGGLITNTDLSQISDAEYPDGMVIVQATLYTREQLGDAVMQPEPTAIEVLQAIGDAQGLTLEVVDGALDGRDSAKAPNPADGFEQEVYVIVIEPNVYALAGIIGVGTDSLTSNVDNIQQVLGTLSVNYAAPLPETPMDYSNLPQGTSAEGFPRLGNPDALASLIEISSFSCPHCGEFHAVGFAAVVARVADGSASFVYVPFYGAGNIGDGKEAARAGMCALEQGKFWEMHDALFLWQQFENFAFARPRLTAGAEALGLDVDAFTTCLDSENTTALIESALAYSQAIEGFQGTPTVLLNDKIVNWFPLQGFNMLIDTAQAPQGPAEVTAEVTPEATAEVTPGA